MRKESDVASVASLIHTYMLDDQGLNPVEVASYVSAVSLSATKLLIAFRPFWDRMPRWLSVGLPVLVLDLPIVAQHFAGVVSGRDLLDASLMSLALVLPGLATPKDMERRASSAKTDKRPVTLTV